MTLQRHGPQLGIPFAKNDGSVCYSRWTAVCWDQQVVLLRLLSRPLDAHRLWCGISDVNYKKGIVCMLTVKSLNKSYRVGKATCKVLKGDFL